MTAPAHPAPNPAAPRGPATSAPANAVTNVPAAAAPGPLSPDHLRALTAARLRMKKITRASNVARFGGWSLGFFAVITLAIGLFGDMVSIVLGALLCGVALNELRGGALLKRLSPNGASLLGYNQIALGAITVVYAFWQLHASLNSTALKDAIASAGDANTTELINQSLGGLDSLNTMISTAVYVSLAVGGAVVPGLTAWYYFSRGKLVRAMLRETPPWVVDVLRT